MLVGKVAANPMKNSKEEKGENKRGKGERGKKEAAEEGFYNNEPTAPSTSLGQVLTAVRKRKDSLHPYPFSRNATTGALFQWPILPHPS